MKKYKVTYYYRGGCKVDVDADSEEDAIERGRAKISNFLNDHEYQEIDNPDVYEDIVEFKIDK